MKKAESKRMYKRWLPGLLALMIALSSLGGWAAAEKDADAAYADFLTEIKTAAQDDSRWEITDSADAPVKAGMVTRPDDAEIADLGDNGFIALQEGVTLIRETNGANGIAAVDGAESGKTTYRMANYLTGTRTDTSSGSRVFIAEQDSDGNWLLNMGTVSSFENGLLTISSPAEGDQMRYIRCFSLSSGQNGGKTVNIPFEEDIKIPGTAGTVLSTGSVYMKGHVELYGSADGDWSFWHTYFWLDLKLQVRMVADVVKIDINSESLGYSVKIIPIDIPIVPGVVGLDFSPKFTISGNLKGTVSFALDAMAGMDLRVSFNYDKSRSFYSKLNLLEDGPHFTQTAYSVQAKVFAGLTWGGNISLFGGLLGMGVNYSAGPVLTAGFSGGHYNPSDKDRKTWHACEDNKCLQGDLRWQKGPISLGISGFWGIVKKTICNFMDPIVSDPILSFYHSDTYGDGGETTCPHVGYRINVHVKNSSGNPVSGAEVSITPREDWFKAVADSVKTDSTGTAVVYAQRANPTKDTKSDSSLAVTVTASYADTKKTGGSTVTASTTVTEKGLGSKGELQPADVYLTLSFVEEPEEPEPKPVPKTGDPGNPGIWAAQVILGVIGIALCVIAVPAGKKKKADRSGR